MATVKDAGVSQHVLKTSFKVESKLEAFYTGGNIQFTSTGSNYFCGCGNKIQIIDTKSGRIAKSLQEDEDETTCFILSPNDEILVTASRSLLLRQWDWVNEKVTRKWKAIHHAPVVNMAFDPTSTLLATGSSDSTIKIWDIIKQYCTHNLRGSQGVVHLVQFHPDPTKLMLFSSSADSCIRIWDLSTSTCISTLKGHYSNVTSLSFFEDNEKMISAGRDKVVILWDLATRKSLKTIPVYEAVESVIVLPRDKELEWCMTSEEEQNVKFITAGEKGIIRAWSVRDGKCIFAPERSANKAVDSICENPAPSSTVIQCVLNEALNCIVTVSDDQNIVLYDLNSLKILKQFVGHLDEVLDLKFVGEDHSLLSVASNSPDVKVIDRETMDCRILNGHTDTIMALDASFDGKYIASCSKDNSLRIWRLGDDKTFSCVALGVGHTHAVGTIAWPKRSTDHLVTGSQDLTLKCWKVPQIFEDNGLSKIQAVWTVKAHDKDINSVVFSPNDKLIASGSQDKTAKLWLASDGGTYGTLRGHKRGVWCAAFSPVDKCLATASADSTIKLWAIKDLTCVKTLEGHTNSVLRLEFMTRGMQIISSGSDGLIKTWNVKTNECLNTLDGHADKVWSLALNKTEDTLVTGGGDSVLNIWKDVTEEERLEEEAKQENMILKDQELSNLLGKKKFTKAIGLALSLERPFTVLSILKELLADANGEERLASVLSGLRNDQIDLVLKYMRDWNTNAKNCHATQSALSIILKFKSPDELTELPDMKDNIEAILPYTERHFNRLNRLLQQSAFLEYTWESMRLSVKDVDTKASEQLENDEEMNAENESHISVGQASNQQTEHLSDLIAMDTWDQHQSEAADGTEETIHESKTQNSEPCEGDSLLEAEPSQEENKENHKTTIVRDESLIEKTPGPGKKRRTSEIGKHLKTGIAKKVKTRKNKPL
ncbi:transducin beta-like protein 3 isoform X3 [Rhopilema esculentum]|uniref:transducin beta-like protein 3 isoform X3 n=1 Tax=Rhopilema esculentum TaxID=499914 RepID=UPI0031E42531